MPHPETSYGYVTTIRLPEELGQRFDAVVDRLSGPPNRLRKAEAIRDAVEAYVKRMERKIQELAR